MITDKKDLRLTPALNVLVDRIAGMCGQSPEAAPALLRGALQEAVSRGGLLRDDQRRGSRANYARHLLYKDPRGRFSVVSLVWGAGQFSPVHGHYTWCGYVIAEGNLQEERYVWDGDRRQAVPAGTAARLPGDACYSHAGLDAIHRLGNSGGPDAISVHVYGLDSARLTTHVNRVVEARN